MNAPAPLSPLTDPASLSKIPILLIPINTSTASIPQPIYASYQSLLKRYTTLRGDELSRPHQARSRTPTGSADLPPNPRLRFFPPSTGNSISISRGATTNHVHLSFLAQPPARHLYPLSLLRMANFPLIVLGIAVDGDEDASNGEGVKGYSVEEESGDIGEVSTPVAPTFRTEDISQPPSSSSARHDTTPRIHNPEESFDELISSLFPSTSPFPLVKRLLIVPPTLPKSPSSPRKPGSVPVPDREGKLGGKDRGHTRYAPMDGAEGWLGRVLGEVVGELLGELGEIATALETPAGMRTLSSTLLPSLTATLPHPGLDRSIISHRSSTPQEYPSRPSSSTPVNIPHSGSLDHLSTNGTGISLTRALTPGGRPTSIQPPSLPPIPTSISPAPQPAPAASSNPFRRSTALSSPFTRASSTTSVSSTSSASSAQVGPTKYTNASLNGVAGGRLLKLLGDFYLISGLCGDAIRCFDDGAERCRSVGDVLWEAAAREGRAVAGIGEAWEGRDGSNLARPFPTSPIPVEILSHYLSALACLSRSPLPYPPTILSPSPQAVSGSISFPAPSSSNPANIGTGEGLLAYLHTSLSLRISHFVLITWASGGWGSIALSSLMSHTLPRSFALPLRGKEACDLALRRKRHRFLALLSSSSQLTRQSIFAHAEQALGPHHRAMTKTEQLTVLTEAVWLARWLDLPRKEAATSREVIKRLAMLVVEGRDESRRLGRAGFGGRSNVTSPTSALASENRSDAAAAVGLGLGMPVPSQNVAVRRKESAEGNSGIIALFERTCEVMGIDLLSFSHHSLGSGPSHRHTHSIVQVDTDRPNLSKGDARFGWPEIQVELLREGIAVAESLPDHPSIIRLALSALNGLNGYLNPQSQGMLNKMYPQALATTRRRGIDIGGMPWWVPGKIVLSVEIASLPPNKLPMEHSREEIVVKQGKKDPFLYNPRLKSAEAGNTILVANEQVDIFVTVRNPFAFDLDIQDLSILTSGAPFITSPLPLILPGSSVQTVRVTGHSPTPGSMQVKGVSIRLSDGASTEILIPIIDSTEKQKRDKRKSRLQTDLGKVKRRGIEARFAMLDKFQQERETERDDELSDVGKNKAKWLECKVLEELPLAWIKRTSLTHGTVMLYNGESSAVRITLENSSSVPIDFIKLSFDDSTAREAHAIIQEGELTPEQAYELEYDQLKRPIFIWENEQEKEGGSDGVYIPPGGRTTISVRCLGKVGCTDGTIRIDYGYLDRPSRPAFGEQGDGSAPSSATTDGENNGRFCTRRISFPILFTVYHTIECHSLDLIRLGPGGQSDNAPPSSGSTDLPNGDEAASRSNANGQRPSLQRLTSTTQTQAHEDVLRSTLHSESDASHCLVALSVRNVYGVPFEVTLSRKQVGAGAPLACTRLVPPGATERMIIPLPRQSISTSLLSQPIPSLSERQYVVDKTNKSTERVKADRELFWFREKLLDLISATWMEPGSMRRGTLSLRDQYLSPSLIDIFRSDGVDVRLTLHSGDDQNPSGRTPAQLESMEFVTVVAEVSNNLEHPFRPYIHLAPLPSSSNDDSWTQPTVLPPSSATPHSARPTSLQPGHGNKHVLLDGLASSSLPLLEPGQTTRYEVGAMFLASGSYGIMAAVEEISETESPGEGGSADDKKFWFSDTLRVDVV